jgi:hypothetical protein
MFRTGTYFPIQTTIVNRPGRCGTKQSTQDACIKFSIGLNTVKYRILVIRSPRPEIGNYDSNSQGLFPIPVVYNRAHEVKIELPL